jgi:DNA-binding CsgD family transcriptional regulator
MKFIDCKTEQERLDFIESCIEKDLVIPHMEIDLVYSSLPSMDINMVKSMLAQRKSILEIATTLGISRQALKKYLWCHKVSLPTQSRSRCTPKVAMHKEQIIALKRQGQSMMSIASQLGLCRQTVTRVCNQVFYNI